MHFLISGGAGLIGSHLAERLLGQGIGVTVLDQEVSITALARKVIELAGSKSNVEHITYQQAYGQPFDDMARRVPCLKRVKATIGFSPVFGLEEIIRSVIADRSQVGQ